MAGILQISFRRQKIWRRRGRARGTSWGKYRFALQRQEHQGEAIAALRGSEELLRGLTRLEPRQRWSVQRALRSPFFAHLRSTGEEPPCAVDAAGAMGEGDSAAIEYMHYY